MTRPGWTRVLTDARKFGVAALGVAAAAAAAGVLPDPFARWAPVVVAAAAAAGVYAIPNAGTYTADHLEQTRATAYARGRLDAVTGAPPPSGPPVALQEPLPDPDGPYGPPAGAGAAWLKASGGAGPDTGAPAP